MLKFQRYKTSCTSGIILADKASSLHFCTLFFSLFYLLNSRNNPPQAIHSAVGIVSRSRNCYETSKPLARFFKMKLLVAVKRVIDYNARIRVKPDKVGIR